jgi:hypothetical protein
VTTHLDGAGRVHAVIAPDASRLTKHSHTAVCMRSPQARCPSGAGGRRLPQTRSGDRQRGAAILPATQLATADRLQVAWLDGPGETDSSTDTTPGGGGAKLSLSSAGTRWGSASSSGAIRLNWWLVHPRPR